MNKKDHYIKFELGISCFSSCKCYYVLFNLEDWENIIHYGNLFASIGKKTYFLALGTIPVTGVGFIGRKNTGYHPLSFVVGAIYDIVVSQVCVCTIILSITNLKLIDFLWLFLFTELNEFTRC